MAEWVMKKLKDIADFNPRDALAKWTVAKKIAMDKLQPFCRDIPGYELEPFSRGTKFRNGDTIMARITPCLENGKTAKVSILDDGEIGFGSTEYIVFRAKEGVDEDFIYYLVCSPLVSEPAIKSMVGSSGRQRVQMDVVQNLEIMVPDYEEQKRISVILKSLDDKIAANTEVNKNLPPHPCNARIAAKQCRQTPKVNECLHTDSKVSDRGGNEETAEQFSSLLVT